MKKKVIIIGAGISGLSAGCYLQMNGYDTEIFELHSLPGGLCTSWNRGDYTFDGCIHWLVGSTPNHEFYNLWNEIVDMKKIDFIEFDVYNRFEDKDGNSLTYFTDADKLEAELLRIAPEDKITIKDFIKAVKKFSSFSTPVDKAPETSSLLDGIKIALKVIPYMGLYKKWLNISVNDFAEMFKNDFIRKALKARPEDDMSALFFVMMFAWMHKKSSGYPIGGSLNFAKQFERKYLELGGKIHYKNKVTEIKVEKNSANGIKTENSEEYKSDYVISAADGYSTIFKMLGGKYTGKKFEEIYKSYKTFPSYIQVSLGVNHNFGDKPHMLNFELDKPLKIDGKTEIDKLNIRIFNFDNTMAPYGKTSMYTMLTTYNYDYWKNLRENDREKYKEEKNRIANEVIEILEKKLGNIKNNIEEIDVSTPATVFRYTNNWKGSYEGWMPSKQTGLMGFKKTLPGLNNFYMIGQWVEVGGGLPPAIMSGRNVTQVICKKDKKKFTTTHY